MFSSSDHISRQFDAELEAIRAHVLQMGGLVESQIKSAVESLVNGDVALMTRVINDDHRVNAMEVKIDEACSQVIARRQPAAGDLRLVMAVIKTITDLERIGDEAEKIARMAKLLSQKQGLAHSALPGNQACRGSGAGHAAQIAGCVCAPGCGDGRRRWCGRTTRSTRSSAPSCVT